MYACPDMCKYIYIYTCEYNIYIYIYVHTSKENIKN